MLNHVCMSMRLSKNSTQVEIDLHCITSDRATADELALVLKAALQSYMGDNGITVLDNLGGGNKA